MDDHIKGHRRSEDDEWTWQPPARRRGIRSWLAPLAASATRLAGRTGLSRMRLSWRPLSPRIPPLPKLPSAASLTRRLRGIKAPARPALPSLPRPRKRVTLRWPRLPRLPSWRAVSLPPLRLPVGPRPLFREMLAAVAPFAAAGLLVTATVLVALATGGDERALVVPIPTTNGASATPATTASPAWSPTPSPAPSPSPTATPPPSPVPTPAPSAAPTPAPTRRPAPGPTPTPFPENQFGVAWWSRQSNRWVFGDLPAPSSSYHQGESVPFLARWPAGTGQNFQVHLVYDCATAAGPALDFIAGVQPGDDLPALTAPGPGRRRPDAAIPLPDDPSISTDDGNPGLLELWGGKFTRLAEGPAPATACLGQKSIAFDATASGGSVFLVGGVHLSSAAATQPAPFGLQLTVTGVGALKVNIALGAITP